MPRPRLLFLAFVTCAAPAFGQEERPRIGLVLSGGGARGAAHVGVLEALEELQVPVDFVVGTSMGAIVGGLYAAGYSPGELREIVDGADWGLLFSGDPPRDELWFRRRQDNRRFQVDLEFAWKNGGIVVPPGLVPGSNIESFLEQLTLPVATVDDFDDLKIPFRCVATDLVHGSAVVFEDGLLAKAIRASMSLPGIFAPVEHEGRLLVDGGAVDNVPVDVARSLGADVLIVVDISSPLAKEDALGSPLSISNQVLGIMMSGNRERAKALLDDQDIAIVPDLGDITLMSFERSSDAMDIGRAATEQSGERLRALAVDGAAWDRYLDRQRAVAQEPFLVRHLRIAETTTLSDSIVRRFSGIREGLPLDADSLEVTRQRLAGLGIFENVEVGIVPVPGEEAMADVVLLPTEKPWGPHYLRFGLGVSSDLSGEGEFDIGVQHTATPLNSLGGEWRNEATIGTRIRLRSEFYQPLDPGLRWFVVPSLAYEHDNLPLRVDGEKVAEVGVEAVVADVAVGRNLGRWGEVRVSGGWLTGSIRPEIAVPGLLPSRTDVEAAVISAALRADTLDSITFPRAGFVGDLDWELVDRQDGGENRSTVAASAGIPMRFADLTIFSTLEAGVTVEGEEDFGAGFQLGGFRRLSGLAPGQIGGNHLALGVLQAYYRMSEGAGLFGNAHYIGASLEYGGVWQDLSDLESDDLLAGGSVYLGFDTLLGAAFIGVGVTEGGEVSTYLFIGPVF